MLNPSSKDIGDGMIVVEREGPSDLHGFRYSSRLMSHHELTSYMEVMSITLWQNTIMYTTSLIGTQTWNLAPPSPRHSY